MKLTQEYQVIRRYRNVSVALALAVATTAALLIGNLSNSELLPIVGFWALCVHQLFYVAFFSLLALTPLPVPRQGRVVAGRAAATSVLFLAVAAFLLFPPFWLPEEAQLGAIFVFIILAGIRVVRSLFPQPDAKQADHGLC